MGGRRRAIRYAMPIVLAAVFLIFIGIPAFEISLKIDLCYRHYDHIDFHPISWIIIAIFFVLIFISFLITLCGYEVDTDAPIWLLWFWELIASLFPLVAIVSGVYDDISIAIAWINSIFFFVLIWTVLILVTRNIDYPSRIFFFTSHLSFFNLPGIIVKWNYMIPILFASIGYAVGEPLGRWMERRIEIREMRERIRREEERRRKEYEQKMKEFKLKLKRWKEEGYDVSELEEMLK